VSHLSTLIVLSLVLRGVSHPPFSPNRGALLFLPISLYLREVMDTLHATIEEFAAEGFTHVECLLAPEEG
jgi:hypothetical protein